MKKYISPTISLKRTKEDVITTSGENIIVDDFVDNTPRNWTGFEG